MMADVWTVAWKEWKEFLMARGTMRTGITTLVITVFIQGVFVPWQTGRAWVERPIFLLVWSWLPAFIVAAVVADSFAGERERHTLETLLASRISDRAILFGKFSAAVGYGWGITIATLLTSLVTVNLTRHGGPLVMYSAAAGLGAVLLSLLAAGLMASAGVLISLRASSLRQAQQTMGLGIMISLFGVVFGFRALPAGMRAQVVRALTTFGVAKIVMIAAAVLLALDALLLAAAMARFQRARLMLD